jgi:hypothetical protein
VADTEEQHAPPASGHAAGGGSGLGRKWHGIPVWGWTLGGTVVAVVAYKWWKGRGAAKAGTTAGTTSTSNCYDSQGNQVPCQGYTAASQYNTLLGAIQGLQNGNPGTTAAKTTTTTSATSGRLTEPGGLHLTIHGPTGVRVVWAPVPGAAGYAVQLKQGGDNGQPVQQFTVTQPVANFGSLKPKTAYTALIWPSSASVPGGPGTNQPHNEFEFTTA